MKVYFKDSKVEKLLTNEKKLIRKYGNQAADKIIQRLGEIDAASHLRELPPAARAHPHEPKREEIFSVDILKHRHPLRLLLKPCGTYDIQLHETIVEVEIQSITKIHS